MTYVRSGPLIALLAFAMSCTLSSCTKAPEPFPGLKPGIVASSAKIDFDSAASYSEQGDRFLKADDLGKAEPAYKRALELYEKNLVESDNRIANAIANLATVYVKQRRGVDAEPLLKRCLSIYEKSDGPSSLATAKIHTLLAKMYVAQNKLGMAEADFKQALSMKEKLAKETNDPSLTEDIDGLASIYDQEDLYAQAEQFYKRGLDIKEIRLGPTDSALAWNLSNLVSIYTRQGKSTEAKRAQDRVNYIERLHPDLKLPRPK